MWTDARLVGSHTGSVATKVALARAARVSGRANTSPASATKPADARMPTPGCGA